MKSSLCVARFLAEFCTFSGGEPWKSGEERFRTTLWCSLVYRLCNKLETFLGWKKDGTGGIPTEREWTTFAKHISSVDRRCYSAPLAPPPPPQDTFHFSRAQARARALPCACACANALMW